MKKLILACVSGVALMGLAACSDTDGTTTRCQGIVWAIFPRDTDGPPVHAACSWCCDPDAEPMIGLWVSEQWRTLGRLIERRREAADTARALAQAIGAAR